MKAIDLDWSSLLAVGMMGAIALTALALNRADATSIATGVIGAVSGWMAHKQAIKTSAAQAGDAAVVTTTSDGGEAQ